MKKAGKMLRHKRFWLLLILLLVLIILILFRTPLLRNIGFYLSAYEEPVHVEALFILGGNSFDRGKAGSELYHQNFCTNIVCSGGNNASVLDILDINFNEADMCSLMLVKNGVPDSIIHKLSGNTSTFEEAEDIAEWVTINNPENIGILSDVFHTKRIKKVMKKAFEKAELKTKFHIFGAPSTHYKEEIWWNYEEGLIFVNNEYIKHVYYFFKYN